MQVLPQGLYPLLHVHLPPTQVVFAGQILPHAPQLRGSVPVLWHVPEQQVWPCGQTAEPLVQH